MKTAKFFLVVGLLSFGFNSIYAQSFDWSLDGYMNHSSGGFYKNIDSSGVNLKITGLVNDEVLRKGVGTGRNNQQAQKLAHTYTFTFSQNVDIEFTLSDINKDTKGCFDDQLVLSGSPVVIRSRRVVISGDTLVQPIQKAHEFDSGDLTVQYLNVKQFTIRHGSGRSCNPGHIMISPINFQKTEKLVQFGKDTLHFQDILFEMEQKLLSDEYNASLDTLLQRMKLDTSMNVILLGFADDQANKEFNSKLSRKRVNAVLTYLILKGVDRSRIEARYFGEKVSENSNVKIYGNGRNRRVEIYTIPGP
jgi:outer membrane protein OmpA-like peptidoglycan-associated protein